MASTPARLTPSIERSFVATRSGRIHVAAAGDGFPVLLLHQTPRSWDEYRDVLPRLGRHHRAVAMDTPGFGNSDPLPGGGASIEGWARAAIDLLDVLGIPAAAVVGHHTGAATAIELAAANPTRIPALVLSSPPFVDADRRARHEGTRVIDEVEAAPDGRHLGELWERRRPFYPAGDIGLLERFIIDALKAGAMAAEGHRVVNRYRMEDRLGLVRCPTLVLAATEDPYAYPVAGRVAAAIQGSVLGGRRRHGAFSRPDAGAIRRVGPGVPGGGARLNGLDRRGRKPRRRRAKTGHRDRAGREAGSSASSSCQPPSGLAADRSPPTAAIT